LIQYLRLQYGQFSFKLAPSTLQEPLMRQRAVAVLWSLENHIPRAQANDNTLDPYVVGAERSNSGMAFSNRGGCPQSIPVSCNQTRTSTFVANHNDVRTAAEPTTGMKMIPKNGSNKVI
jgi:hypothetical protein